MRQLIGVLAAAGLAALLYGCGGSDSPASGTVTVSLTDAPVDDAEAVWVQVNGIAFKPEGSAAEIVKNFTPRAINLLQYQRGLTAVLLDNIPFEPGRYEWLRLMIDAQDNVRDTYLVMGGQECELRVPSGAQTGLKMNRGFTIPAAGSLALTIDFDLHKSIHAAPGQAVQPCSSGFILRPTLRLVNDAEVGAVAGTVTFEAGTAPAECNAKVYLFDGAVNLAQVKAQIADGDDIDALIAPVEVSSDGNTGSYKLAFVPAGSYLAAFSCSDDSEAAPFEFVPDVGAPVTVQTNLISSVDFTVPAI